MAQEASRPECEQFLDSVFGPVEETQAGSRQPGEIELYQRRSRFAGAEELAWQYDRMEEPDIMIFSGGGLHD